MNYLEAMELRCSRRSYQSTPIDGKSLRILNELTNKYNKESGLSIQLIENGSNSFHGILKSYGMFHGVQSFFAMAGTEEDPHMREKIGYYGELLVLEATKLGLGTCWVGGTFDKKNCPCSLKNKEALVCVITVGNVLEKQSLRERTIHKLTHTGTKSLEYYYTCDAPVPEWFLKGIQAVSLAPSAVNRKPVHFILKHGIVSAAVKNTNGFQLVDLGIAKLHFELATERHFEWGNNGKAPANKS
ncbi:MAG: Nitroreductase family protein [Herbinix sp.]|jgi:nitroreductase|nr:Nitroreductase family protein [Herbinix sp.]